MNVPEQQVGDTQEQRSQAQPSAPIQTVNAAVEFLRRFRPDGPWVLSAIVPDRRISTTTFRSDQGELLRSWLEVRDGSENVYFQVNDSGSKVLHKKASKADIEAAAWLHVDVDPGDDDLEHERWKILKRLEAREPQPHVIIDSGGGFQAFWRIAPTDDLADVEAANRWLAQELGGDSCHNIDRIMRLPGTTNVPNEKKRAAGRKPARAQLIRFEDGVLDMACVGRSLVEKDNALNSVDIRPLGDWEGPTDVLFLCEALPPWAFRLLQDPADSSGRPFVSRSEHVWAFVGACVRDGVPAELIRWCITNPNFRVAAHILDQKNIGRAADRTIARMEAAHAGE